MPELNEKDSSSQHQVTKDLEIRVHFVVAAVASSLLFSFISLFLFFLFFFFFCVCFSGEEEETRRPTKIQKEECNIERRERG